MSVLQIKTRQIYPLYPSCVNICKTTFHKNDIRFVLTSSCLYDASCLIYVFAFVCYSGVKHILCSVFVLFFVVLFVPYVASFSGLFLYCFSSSCLYPILPVSLCFSSSCLYPMLPVSLDYPLPVSLDYPFFIVLSVFSYVYFS